MEPTPSLAAIRPLPGAKPLGGGRYRFDLWAPHQQHPALRLLDPAEKLVPLVPDQSGYFALELGELAAGTRYFFRLDDGSDRPDPASRSQPEGVHGPSALADLDYSWSDASWRGLAQKDYLFYELHVGTFSPAGTFAGVIGKLPYLKELGVTAVELLPVAAFPGGRNWGYDGTQLYAPHAAYGGARGLQQLVDACHSHGLAAVLDVVYNHLGPEGNYLSSYGPYFTGRYQTPWGEALNFDGADSDEVRHFFVQNALYWLEHYHFDALRLDAVHGIFDFSAKPFLQELAEAVACKSDALGRPLHLFPESDLNAPRLIQPPEIGGYGLHAQWSDDLHHALHVLLTGEESGYYADFGQISQLARCLREGYVYSGQPSRFRRKRHGRPPVACRDEQFIVFGQNHDQVGNRMLGERLGALVSFEALKLAAGSVLLSPYLPLLFMGEEYGETAPFQYFVSHGDPDLVASVRAGRREEFAGFAWQGEPPDPQDEATFRRSQLDHTLRQGGQHQLLFTYYQELIRLRKALISGQTLWREAREAIAFDQARVLLLLQPAEAQTLALAANFADEPRDLSLPLPAGSWHLLLDSADARWGGPGSRCPVELTSAGELPLPLSPHSLILLTSQPR